eukprot:TRINITY_DN12281_c1_g6_i1.p1 TRINITY_DN12281_c1_g6~~TRINITY_DN12281_c1_g6_i1.p1  ORF type:complete len:217 (+),score=19.51 TRINITY_DN12281_c1_g6_i1:76-726(+)
MSPKPAKKAKRERQLDGIPETQALRMTIPDYIQDDLNVLFCGINPGVWSAARGHHYAGPGNHFWPCLSHSGLVPSNTNLNYNDDAKCLQYKIGFTNSVIRTTRGSTDLSKDELVAGGKRLRLIIEKHQPKIACFNGKGMFEAFIGRRCKFYGVQPERIGDTIIFAMPSTSARSATRPKWQEKVVFFHAMATILADRAAGRMIASGPVDENLVYRYT